MHKGGGPGALQTTYLEALTSQKKPQPPTEPRQDREDHAGPRGGSLQPREGPGVHFPRPSRQSANVHRAPTVSQALL